MNLNDAHMLQLSSVCSLLTCCIIPKLLKTCLVTDDAPNHFRLLYVSLFSMPPAHLIQARVVGRFLVCAMLDVSEF